MSPRKAMSYSRYLDRIGVRRRVQEWRALRRVHDDKLTLALVTFKLSAVLSYFEHPPNIQNLNPTSSHFSRLVRINYVQKFNQNEYMCRPNIHCTRSRGCLKLLGLSPTVSPPFSASACRRYIRHLLRDRIEIFIFNCYAVCMSISIPFQLNMTQ